MSQSVKLTTADVEPHLRLDYWRSLLADAYTPVELRDCSRAGFEAELEMMQVGNLSLTQCEGVSQTFVRSESLIKSSDRDDYVAAIQLKTGIRYSVNGRDGVTAAGSITLYDMARPFVCESVDPVSSLDIHIPRDVFEHVFGPTANAIGLTIGPELPSGPVVSGFFRSLHERSSLFDPSTASRMAAIGIDLLAAGFAEMLALEPRMGIAATTLVYRAKTFIEEHLGNSALDTAMTAAALNLSVRRLQEVFAEHELAVDGYIWDRRLTKALRRLRDPSNDDIPIANVAYGVGFTSAAHFARRFRQRFGMSATECRERARLERKNIDGATK